MIILRHGATAMLAVALISVGAALGPRPTSGSAALASPVTMPGFKVTLFASGTDSYSHPDSVEYDSYLGYTYVGYQNITAKDGSDNKTSTVVEYTADGAVRGSYAVPGHCDGLRTDPSIHMVWASSNEDGNSVLTVINPVDGQLTNYTFPPAPHGGGYDDMAFVNGQAFIAASNPNLNSAGINVFPALDQIQLQSNGTVTLKPVVMGNDTATDTTTNQTVSLNEVDPDSLTVNPQGDVVMTNQAGSELVFVHQPGTSKQSLTRIPVGTQVDDTVWATSQTGRLLVVDGATNAVWSLSGPFTTGDVYAETPSDSGVAGLLGTVDLATGTISPAAMGFKSPTGLLFVPGK